MCLDTIPLDRHKQEVKTRFEIPSIDSIPLHPDLSVDTFMALLWQPSVNHGRHVHLTVIPTPFVYPPVFSVTV